MAFYRAVAFALATCVVAEDPRCQADENVLLQGVMRKVRKTDVERTMEQFEDEGGHSRVAADQLAPPSIAGFAPGVRGWCRTANGDAEGVNGAVLVPPESVFACARQCLASPTCQAFEFSAPRRGRGGRFSKACKLHNSPMPGPVGEIEEDDDGYAQCYNTIAAAEAAAEAAAQAAQFFHNFIGKDYVIGTFENDDYVSVPDPSGERFLRRVDCTSRVIRAHVQGGSCGDATIQFGIDDATAEFFRTGARVGRRWAHNLINVTVVSGEVADLPDRIWTTSGEFSEAYLQWRIRRGLGPPSRGWALERAAYRKIFASSRGPEDRTDYCNSNPLQGGETVTLSCV